MSRENWKSRVGFIWAAVGSAVGLGNIWRFPYIIGENGGGAFLLVYIICLLAVGIPVLVAEILIGRVAQKSPAGAFYHIGKTRVWRGLGFMTIITGFLVSGFYAVVCTWTLVYLVRAIFGGLTHFTEMAMAVDYFTKVTHSIPYSIGFLVLFMVLCFWILVSGVQKGIEGTNKVMMPLLFIILVILVVKGLFLSGASAGVTFMFKPDFSAISPAIWLMALGQAFFALSLGQGTMVTYGSYLARHENIPLAVFPIALFSTSVSFLAGLAIFPIVFTMGLPPASGTGLMFETLPLVFASLPGGYFLALAFFALLFMAGITSEISAMEPLIAYLIDRWGWKRKQGALLCIVLSTCLAIPCVLSFGPWAKGTLFGKNFFDLLAFVCVNLLIPIGGFLAALLVGWKLTWHNAFIYLKEGTGNFFERYPLLQGYFFLTIRFLAPMIIIVIFSYHLVGH